LKWWDILNVARTQFEQNACGVLQKLPEIRSGGAGRKRGVGKMNSRPALASEKFARRPIKTEKKSKGKRFAESLFCFCEA